MISINQNLFLRILLIGLFFVSRSINIGADIPFGFRILNFSNFDEISYSIPAINIFHYRSWDIEYFGMKFIDSEGFISIPIWNLLQGCLLEIFQNKLIALRTPAIISGALIYLIFLSIISLLRNEFNKSSNLSKSIFILFAIYPLFDATFFISNTVNEATIYRLLVASTLFYFFIRTEKITNKSAFWIGIISCFSITFVYAYNLFLILFAFLVLLQKSYRNTIPYFLAGISVVILLYFIVYHQTLNVPFLETITSILTGGMRGIDAQDSILDKVRKMISCIFGTNFLIFSPAILVFLAFGLFALPFFEKESESIDSKVFKLSCYFFLAFILQNLVISDFPQKKGLVVYVPALTISYIFLTRILSLNSLRAEESLILKFISVILALGLLIYTFYRSVTMKSLGYFQIYSWISFSGFFYFGFSVLCILTIFFRVSFPKLRFSGWVATVLLTFSIIFNAQLIFIHKIINSRYSFYETIQEIGKIPPGYFIANFSYYFTLGNQLNKPFLYLYVPKLTGVAHSESPVNQINMQVYTAFLARDKQPLYTVMQGEKAKLLILDLYPKSEVVYLTEKFRDIESYIDYRYSLGLESKELNEISVIKLVR